MKTATLFFATLILFSTSTANAYKIVDIGSYNDCVIVAQQLKLHLLESGKALDCAEKKRDTTYDIGCIMRNDPNGLRLIQCFKDGRMVDPE